MNNNIVINILNDYLNNAVLMDDDELNAINNISNNKTLLGNDKLNEIYNRSRNGEKIINLAKEFNVSHSYISMIKKNKIRRL